MWHVDMEFILTLVSNYANSIGLRKKKSNNWWEEAGNLPRGAIHCQMNRRFCGNCSATPPCTFASFEELKALNGSIGLTSIWPCKLCTKEMRLKWTKTDTSIGTERCPCWEKPPKSRIIEYKKWRVKYERDNILTAERRRVYGKKRQRKNDHVREKQVQARYSEGRICAAEECENRITNGNTTGYCRKHTWLARE